MEMYFVTSTTFHDLLFKGLNINNNAGLAGACIITFLATVIFEAMKMFKTYLQLRLNENPLSHVQNMHSQEHTDSGASTRDEVILLSSLQIPVTLDQIRRRKIVLHILNSLSHMVNFCYGYLLMLLVMTYNVWLFISVIVGCGVGYFFFGALNQTLQLRYKQLQTSHMSAAGQDHHQSISQECAGSL